MVRSIERVQVEMTILVLSIVNSTQQQNSCNQSSSIKLILFFFLTAYVLVATHKILSIMLFIIFYLDLSFTFIYFHGALKHHTYFF